MKRTVAIAAILLAGVLVFTEANMAQAQWSALSSGYAVTTNWHGKDVPIGADVTVWAGTTDSTVKKVQFKWKYPNETVAWDITVKVVGPYETPNVPPGAPPEMVDWASKNPGIKVWYASNTQIPLVLGDWGVQAIFKDLGGKRKGQHDGKIAIRATSFFVVPEPATAATLLSMLGALALAKRKKMLHF